MRKLFIIGFALALCLGAGAAKKKKVAAPAPHVARPAVCLYGVNPNQGLKLAVQADIDSVWTELAQVISSDYSGWGSQKKMHSPSVYPLKRGGYVALFGLNDVSPCFGVAWSADLMTWRPQDYPHVSTKGCFEPVLAQAADGSCTILYRSKAGDYRKVGVVDDFRHFTADAPATKAEYDAACPQRDTIHIGNDTRIGNRLAATAEQIAALKAHFAKLGQRSRRGWENFKGDAAFAQKLGGKRVEATLTIDAKNQKPISDKLIGVFFEDISYAADGGLYAEMVQNRDFEYTAKDRGEWNATTAWSMGGGKPVETATDGGLSDNNPHYAIVATDTLLNSGFDGFTLKAGAKYDFSFYARLLDCKAKRFAISLVKGGKTIATAIVKTAGTGWQRYTATLTAAEDATGASLALVPMKKGRAAVDMVSLFPQDTYKGHGLRRDLAEAIAALHPKFVRFPGGCMSHGQGLDNIYHWQHTVGPWQDRKPDFNIWRYHQTRGLGFYEYFQWCEDMGAEPLPVLAAGVPCQNSGLNKDGFGGQQDGIPMADMPAYIQELLDLIEWANGDPATSKWAKMRADAGHPAPFNMKYIGIGNEDIISTVFEDRCKMICEAIKAKHPEITICGTVGPFHYPSSDYVEGWRFAKENKKSIDMVDEHYYESPGWFLNNQDYYDAYDRSAPKVYLGEYAANHKPASLANALSEAVHLCGIERNADVVAMTSYAPLLCNTKHRNWSPDMIYFNNDGLTLTPSYQTQRLFGTYAGDRYIASRLAVATDSAMTHRVAASVVRDSKSGQTWLKAVNVLPVPVRLAVDAKGMPIADKARYEGFSGKDTNAQAMPQTESGDCTKAPDGRLIVELPAYSMRVVAL